MRVGPYTVTVIETGEFALDGGAMFGIIPRPLWAGKIGVDPRNRIDMRLRSLLVQGEVAGRERTILIDTGIGTKWTDKSLDIFRIDHSRFDLITALAQHGVTPDDVTDVILTHLHFDHAGGGTTRSASGKCIPTFSKATYYVQKSHLAWAEQPTMKDRGSFMAEDCEPLLTAKQLEVLEGPTELFPGIQLRLMHGHTTAMQHPLITDGNNTLFYCADLVPTSLHVALPWIMAYDIRPLVTIDEKEAFLREAHAGHWTLVFQHCPLVAAATLAEGPRGLIVGTSVHI